MESRLEDLEFRIAHQEAAIDELTRTNLFQQQQIAELKVQIEHLQSLIKEISLSAVGSTADEPPPPHY